MKLTPGRIIKWSIELVIGGGLLFAAIYLVRNAEPQRAARRSATSGPQLVVVSRAQMQDLDSHIESLGTTIAWESVDISAQVTEKVTKIGFEDGQTVTKGDILVELDDAQERANKRVAELNIAEHTRERDRLAWLFEQDAIAKKELDDRETLLSLAQAALTKAEARA